ncbi:MAG: DNA repair protein RadA [Patescibacteria group bacterium]
MGSKKKPEYVCLSCGAHTNAWSGKCFSCGEWDTLEQVAGHGSADAKLGAGNSLMVSQMSSSKSDKSEQRMQLKMKEINTLLGGGLVTGSVLLIAGQPGVGKSTLLLQVADAVNADKKVLYVSGEESEHQVSSRFQRLGLKSTNIDIVSSNSADDIASTFAGGDYGLVIVDSIQTVSTSTVTSAQGGVSQIVNSTNILVQAAKRSNTSMVLVGHVTKEGTIAGPKLLEHVVDVVLQLEGDKFAGYKLLRTTKNRYGSVDEVVVMEMKDNGLMPVDNPSAALLEERTVVDGSVVFPALEGSKTLLVEIQALTNKTSFGYPKRTSVGINNNRLNLLIAILEKRTKLKLSEHDVYVSVSGGVTISEPAVDLAVCMAIASSISGLALPKDSVVYGELGLGGEIRRVVRAEARNKEAKKLGFKTIIAPTKSKRLTLRSLLNTHLK